MQRKRDILTKRLCVYICFSTKGFNTKLPQEIGTRVFPLNSYKLSCQARFVRTGVYTCASVWRRIADLFTISLSYKEME